MPPDVERFRAEQVVWGAVGALVGVVLGVLAMLFRGASALPVVLLVVCFAGAGIVGRDLWLTRAANQRERRMLAEFPTIAELLALAVSAGEGAIGALDRVCRLSRGELSSELGACLAEARAGANLPTALQGLADRTGLTSLSRFVDGIVVAVERGTPLADVLRAQAQDVRESGRRAVMEEGGRKEIGMMIPDCSHGLRTGRAFAHHFDARVMRQQRSNARSARGLVVGNENSDAGHTSILRLNPSDGRDRVMEVRKASTKLFVVCPIVSTTSVSPS